MGTEGYALAPRGFEMETGASSGEPQRTYSYGMGTTQPASPGEISRSDASSRRDIDDRLERRSRNLQGSSRGRAVGNRESACSGGGCVSRVYESRRAESSSRRRLDSLPRHQAPGQPYPSGSRSMEIDLLR